MRRCSRRHPRLPTWQSTRSAYVDRMKILIRTPALWFSKTESISWYIVNCLRRRGFPAKPSDFDFINQGGLTMMDVRSAECSPQEHLAIEDCILRLNEVLGHSALAEEGKHTFFDDLRQFSYEDKKELEDYEKLFKKWFEELDAARKQGSEA
jgi:hypothetical protein